MRRLNPESAELRNLKQSKMTLFHKVRPQEDIPIKSYVKCVSNVPHTMREKGRPTQRKKVMKH